MKKSRAWNLETIALLKEKAQFLFIDTSNKIVDYKVICVTDAAPIWEKNVKVNFLTNSRIAGLTDDIYDFLESQGIGENDRIIDEIFSDRFDGTDKPDSVKNYEKEIRLYRAWHKKEFLKLDSDGDSISELVNGKRDLDRRAEKIAATVYKSPPKTGKALDLAKRLTELPEGKVLDVSNMDELGKGARAAPFPKKSSKKSKKVMIDGLNIMSDNVETYNYALNLLPGGAEEYSDFLNKFRRALEYKDPKYDNEQKIKEANERNNLPDYLKPELFQNKAESDTIVKPIAVKAAEMDSDFESKIVDKYWMQDIGHIQKLLNENIKISQEILPEDAEEVILERQQEAVNNIEKYTKMLSEMKIQGKLDENAKINENQLKSGVAKLTTVKITKPVVMSSDALKNKNIEIKKINKSPVKIISRKPTKIDKGF